VAVLLREGGDRRRIAGLLDKVTVVTGSLAEPSAWEEQCALFAPDAVVHLAWSGVSGDARNDQAQTVNVHHTVELLKVAERAGARHFIGLGSQAEYGPCSHRIDEHQPARPTTLYGVSKFCAGTLSAALCAQQHVRFAWLRLFSCYGPGDNPSWLIPSLVHNLQLGRRPALTRCEQLWDYIYVDDVAEAIARVTLSGKTEGVFNLGSGIATPLFRIVEMIRDLASPGAQLGIGEIPYRPDQVMHLEADITRLREATGWHPRTELADGLRRTVDFHLCNP